MCTQLTCQCCASNDCVHAFLQNMDNAYDHLRGEIGGANEDSTGSSRRRLQFGTMYDVFYEVLGIPTDTNVVSRWFPR